MDMSTPKEQRREQIIEEIIRINKSSGRLPSVTQFTAITGRSYNQIQMEFETWNNAVVSAGLQPNTTYERREPAELLADWGALVRKLGRIPTRIQYAKHGKFSPGPFRMNFGTWSAVPSAFRAFAEDKLDWSDVVALLPVSGSDVQTESVSGCTSTPSNRMQGLERHTHLDNRATYGNPLDFRGLRHEPVNEQGVVFLFGMVARELGYMVEAIQSGFPDCEAKRQIGSGKWQRVFIEFEYESRNFRDHGHSVAGCDIIVCWTHNWQECPSSLEILELRGVIGSLASSDD